MQVQATAKRGNFEQEELGQYDSANHSVIMLGMDDQNGEEGAFAVPLGCALRAKQRTPLAAPSIASGSTTGGDTAT